MCRTSPLGEAPCEPGTKGLRLACCGFRSDVGRGGFLPCRRRDTARDTLGKEASGLIRFKPP